MEWLNMRATYFIRRACQNDIKAFHNAWVAIARTESIPKAWLGSYNEILIIVQSII